MIYPDSRFIIDGDRIEPVERIVGLYIYVDGYKFHRHDDYVGPNTWKANNHTFELCT